MKWNVYRNRGKNNSKSFLNAAHIRGFIDGIAGADSISLNLLKENDMLFID
jgi:hypothetical protein